MYNVCTCTCIKLMLLHVLEHFPHFPPPPPSRCCCSWQCWTDRFPGTGLTALPSTQSLSLKTPAASEPRWTKQLWSSSSTARWACVCVCVCVCVWMGVVLSALGTLFRVRTCFSPLESAIKAETCTILLLSTCTKLFRAAYIYMTLYPFL